jgi:hypothetical protein
VTADKVSSFGAANDPQSCLEHAASSEIFFGIVQLRSTHGSKPEGIATGRKDEDIKAWRKSQILKR